MYFADCVPSLLVFFEGSHSCLVELLKMKFLDTENTEITNNTPHGHAVDYVEIQSTLLPPHNTMHNLLRSRFFVHIMKCELV